MRAKQSQMVTFYDLRFGSQPLNPRYRLEVDLPDAAEKEVERAEDDAEQGQVGWEHESPIGDC